VHPRAMRRGVGSQRRARHSVPFGKCSFRRSRGLNVLFFRLVNTKRDGR
jgi:hypothetical protein